MIMNSSTDTLEATPPRVQLIVLKCAITDYFEIIVLAAKYYLSIHIYILIINMKI